MLQSAARSEQQTNWLRTVIHELGVILRSSADDVDLNGNKLFIP